LGIRRIFFSDPAAGEAGGLLLSAERTPNRRGAEAAGFAPRPVDLEALAEETDLLLAFGSGFEETAAGLSAAALAAIPAKALFSPRMTARDELFDAVMPTRRPAEKAGSFTNVDARVQYFEPALPGPEACLSDAEIIARLAGEAV
jgi:NADH dehydrogenase/NADH:ubiquinone oxidoreductase subunit G